MTNLKYIIIALTIIALSSCEDKIDIDLQDADSILVIDAFINNNEEAQIINITTTHPYLENIAPPIVDDAVVTVTSDSGSNFDFENNGNGQYIWTPGPGEKLGEVGDIFSLNVIHDGNNYSSTSKLNRVPVIDSITNDTVKNAFQDGIYCEFFSRDAIGIGDVYWIKSFKNGSYLSKPQELNIAYDASFDRGGEVDGLIFIPPIRDLINPFPEEFGVSPWDVGDEIRVEIHSLNEEIFAFLELGRDQIINGDNSIFAEPLANTVGNISNDSGGTKPLGAFNVAAIASLDRIIE